MAIETVKTIAEVPTAREHERIHVRVQKIVNQKGDVIPRIDVRKHVTAKEEGGFEGFTKEGFSLSGKAAGRLLTSLTEALDVFNDLCEQLGDGADVVESTPKKKAPARKVVVKKRTAARR